MSSTFQVIPAIDLLGGQCVRLSGGDYNQVSRYESDPLKQALRFQEAGLRYLHLVDLDGAKAGRVINWQVVERLTAETQLHIDFGGGVRSSEELSRLLALGVKQVTAGSLAVKNPGLVQEWIAEWGPEVVILGADVRQGQIAISGWEEKSELALFPFLENWLAQGIRRVICTDVSRDGKLSGPALDLYAEILSQFPTLELVASGGVAQLSDLQACQHAGLAAAIVGKAYYEGHITLEQLASL